MTSERKPKLKFEWHPAVIDGVYLTVQSEEDHSKDINIWLVNDTDEDLEYIVRSQSYASLDQGVLESSVFETGSKKITRRATVLFETTNIWDTDFVVNYDITFKTTDGRVRRGIAIRPKGCGNPSRADVPIPFTEVRGSPLVIRAVIDSRTASMVPVPPTETA